MLNSRANRLPIGTPVRRTTLIAPSREAAGSSNKQIKFNTQRGTRPYMNNRNFKFNSNKMHGNRHKNTFRSTSNFGRVIPLSSSKISVGNLGSIFRMVLLAAKGQSNSNKEAITGITNIVNDFYNDDFYARIPKTRLVSKLRKQGKKRTSTNAFLKTVFNPRSTITVRGLSTAFSSYIVLKRALVRAKRYRRHRAEVGMYQSIISRIFNKYKSLTKTFSTFPVKTCVTSLFSNILSRHNLVSNKQEFLKKDLSTFLKK